MQKTAKVIVQDYGTNCKDCERYRVMGDICMLEHSKKFQWEYCRDFVPRVVLPDYNELMRSVQADRALERQKEKERKEREKRRKLKERAEKEELRKKKRRAMLRKRREHLKKKLSREQMLAEKGNSKKDLVERLQFPKVNTESPGDATKKPRPQKIKSATSGLKDPQDRVVGKGNSIAGKSSDVSDNQ